MPTYSNTASDTNENRLASYFTEMGCKVKGLGRFATADLDVTTPDGRRIAVEFKRRNMRSIDFYDNRGGLTISCDKIDKMETEYADYDGRRWVVECDTGYHWIDIENREGKQMINRTKPRPGFSSPGVNDREMGYAYLGKNFRSF